MRKALLVLVVALAVSCGSKAAPVKSDPAAVAKWCHDYLSTPGMNPTQTAVAWVQLLRHRAGYQGRGRHRR